MSTTTLAGRVGSDPELRYSSNQTPVANFRFAASRRKKAADGTWGDETTWWTVTAFGNLAEDVKAGVAKGDLLVVSGRLEIREADGPDGSKRTYLDLTADEIGKSIKWAAKDAGTATERQAVARVEAAFTDEPF